MSGNDSLSGRVLSVISRTSPAFQPSDDDLAPAPLAEYVADVLQYLHRIRRRAPEDSGTGSSGDREDGDFWGDLRHGGSRRTHAGMSLDEPHHDLSAVRRIGAGITWVLFFLAFCGGVAAAVIYGGTMLLTGISILSGLLAVVSVLRVARLRWQIIESISESKNSSGDHREVGLSRVDLLREALHDPSLIDVIWIYDEVVPMERKRQYLFAELNYYVAILNYRQGALSAEGLQRYLFVLARNAIFRQYWELSRRHREYLANGEAELIRQTDLLIQESDELDVDEWWVIGSPFE